MILYNYIIALQIPLLGFGVISHSNSAPPTADTDPTTSTTSNGGTVPLSNGHVATPTVSSTNVMREVVTSSTGEVSSTCTLCNVTI